MFFERSLRLMAYYDAMLWHTSYVTLLIMDDRGVLYDIGVA